MNSVNIMGRLGRDPESRMTPSGQKVTTFPVATSVYRGGKEETIWFRVTIWGDRFDKLLQYLSKGKPVVVVGQISKAPEIWKDNTGQARVSSLEITADSISFNPFGGKNDEQQTGQGTQQQPQQAQQSQQQTQQQYPSQSYQAPQAAPQPGTSMGYGSGSPSDEGDPLPF